MAPNIRLQLAALDAYVPQGWDVRRSYARFVRRLGSGGVRQPVLLVFLAAVVGYSIMHQHGARGGGGRGRSLKLWADRIPS